MTDLLRSPSVARSDSVTSRPHPFSSTVPNCCLSRSYNIQVKNAVVWKKRMDDILWSVSVPEDAISGTLVRCTMCSLLTLAKSMLLII